MTSSKPPRKTEAGETSPAMSPANLPTEAELRAADLEADDTPRPCDSADPPSAAETSSGKTPRKP